MDRTRIDKRDELENTSLALRCEAVEVVKSRTKSLKRKKRPMLEKTGANITEYDGA